MEKKDILEILLEDNKNKYKLIVFVALFENKNTEYYKQYLSNREYKYYDSLEYPKRKNTYLISRYMAKKAIGYYVGKDFPREFFIINGFFGQPIIKELTTHNNLQISITHCENIGACIVYDESILIGIDIERIRKDSKSIIEYCSEINKIGLSRTIDCKEENEFYTIIWTLMEAISKVIKTGFTVDMGIFEIKNIEKLNNTYICYYKNFPHFIGKSFVFDKYVVSIVYPKKFKDSIDINLIQRMFQSTFK